ncbi:hypothetical protein QN277_001680 [Acacia crassicarpa]|uniref:Nodule inception protein n=1 Tax=Acacia crassicarpa TaxID=499986 RepID=A0AAE1NA59_9FABA|nr:hypothetical protein QN277_001680 [Acacia crassicarpa]
MEYGAALVHNNSAFETISDSTNTASVSEVEGDFIDELFAHGCWLETTTGGSYNLTNPPSLINSDPNFHNYWTPSSSDPNHHHHQIYHQQDQSSEVSSNNFPFLFQSESFAVASTEVAKRWWIGPKANPGPSSSVKERLLLAVGYLREYTKNTNMFLQIWVPTRRSSLVDDPNGNKNLEYYRNVSKGFDHHHHQLAASEEECAAEEFRVVLGKLPDHHHYQWNTPTSVRFFKSHEYVSYVNYAPLHYDLRGSLALPVFERGSGTSLGVVEIVMTNHNIDYHPQIDNVCHTLQTVDFNKNACQNLISPALKVFDELYLAALNEIVEVLTSVCKTHNLPLALTWSPCAQQSKAGLCPNDNFVGCLSTVDSACYVADLELLGFQEACSEYHLLRGQGIVGTAFTTTKPCFATDITAFSKTEYPLSQHAAMFGLRAAVAIPLRSVYTGAAADFVLEFFLPKNCHDGEEQKQLLNFLCIVVQQAACRSFHVAMDNKQMEEEEEFTFTVGDMLAAAAASSSKGGGGGAHHKEETLEFGGSNCNNLDEAASCSKESSWIAHMMEAQTQHKGKGVSVVSLEYLEEPKQEFKVTTNWRFCNNNNNNGQTFSDYGQVHPANSAAAASRAISVEGGGESYAFGGGSGRRSSSGGRKSGEKRRTKAEKTISLPVLRQYFAGSLKDAAKSIGVCPTTLKRICRQHGITRWPSRKIKKVGHSLRKLQLVIDSVQGADGAIQIGSFYSSFPELSSTNLSSATDPSQSSNIGDHAKKLHNNNPHRSEHGLYSHHHGGGATTLKSPPSCCSQTSTIINAAVSSGGGDVLMAENPEASLQLRALEQKLSSLGEHPSTVEVLPPPPLPENSGGWNNARDGGAFRVKATFGDEKIRFSLQPNWGFRELKMEIARRFNVDDLSNIGVKYLDEEGEWVLLTCDADLEESKDTYRSSKIRTMRFALFQASPLNLATNTLGSNSSS